MTDTVTIALPRGLVERAQAMGLDVEELALRSISEALGLDPREVADARLELAERALAEAVEYLARGDPVQASEKLYKAVEECIKALAEALGAPQLAEVRRRGKWDTWLLGRAATDLSKMLGEEKVRSAWANAYDVHVWGLHEAKYRVEDVEAALPLARWLLQYARQAAARR